MSCVRSIKFVIPGGPGAPNVEVYAEEQGGALVFTVTVLSTPTLTADLRGLFFDIADDSQLTGMAFSQVGTAVTDFDTGNVIDLGNGANMNGAADPFDVGLEFGTQGIGKDDIKTATFTLTNADGDLTLDDIAQVEFGARLTSIGAPGGKRADSAKLTTIAPAAPDAVDDSYPNLFEDGASGLDDPSKTPQGILLQVLANDTDADGDTLTITGFDGGPLHGTVQIVDGDDADLLIGDAVLYTPDLDYAGDDSFVYCITDNKGGTDFAEVTLTLAAVADVPLMSFEIIAGGSVTEIILRVTATQNDAYASEFIDRILLSVDGGLPAGTIVPATVNPLGTPGSITQDFLITVPLDQDVSYTLDITAWSEEFSNGDQQSATTSLLVETSYTQNLLEATFTATDQSIWNTGNQFTFTDDRFLGIDTSWNESSGGFVYGQTDGRLKAGFQSTLTFEAGEIDATAAYDLSVETLYNKTTDVLFLTADALFDPGASSFTTEGPEGSYQLDFLFDFLLRASAGVDAGIDSFDIFSVQIGPFATTQNIIDYDSNDGTAVTIGLPAGFSLTFAWPNIDTASGPGTTTVILSDGASNNFFELGLDVDDLVFKLLGMPNPFKIGFDVGVADGSIQIADLDLSFGLNFLQEFAMAAGALTGTITWEDGSSQGFDFNTDITVANASSLDLNDDNIITYELELAPSVTLNNDTDLGFNFGVQFEVLKLSGSYDIVVDSGSLKLGPLFSVGTTVPLGQVDVYDSTFDLAFGSQDYLFAA